MSEQTPRRRRADRAYTPEKNEAAPCRRRMNADAPPRRCRTREYYSPEEFIPYPAADSFDAMPPDIPFDVPPNTPSAPPKRKFRLPPLGESLRRTMQLLRSARPDFPFRRPHGVGDLLNMLLDVLLWLPKLTVHLTLYACRYLRCLPEDLTEAMICACLASVSDMAIIPMADWLHLGAEARINTPSTQGANWQWRLDTPLTSLLAEHIADLTALYDRAPAAADR